MSTKKTSGRRKMTEEDIDNLVVAQAGNDSAWEVPVQVRRGEPGTISIPADLAARAAFLAQVHRASGVEEWLTRVIRERIELEEATFAEAKRDLAGKQEAYFGHQDQCVFMKGAPRASIPMKAFPTLKTKIWPLKLPVIRTPNPNIQLDALARPQCAPLLTYRLHISTSTRPARQRDIANMVSAPCRFSDTLGVANEIISSTVELHHGFGSHNLTLHLFQH